MGKGEKNPGTYQLSSHTAWITISTGITSKSKFQISKLIFENKKSVLSPPFSPCPYWGISMPNFTKVRLSITTWDFIQANYFTV